MATVDAKGRIVLPQELREQLGLSTGTEVEVHERDGKAVVEPEANPAQIIERMERLIEETSGDNTETTPVDPGDMDPIAQKHRDAIRRGARDSDE